MADETEPKPKQQSSARERFERARTQRKTTAPRSRPPSPTRSIEPGAIHYQIAEGILRGAQQRAESFGLPLDVGEFPQTGDSTSLESDDPQRIVKRTAHIVARVGDRFSFLRRVSRHFEGTDKRAGLLSDVGAVVYALYERNPDSMRALGQQFVRDFQLRRAARAATPQNGAPVTGNTFATATTNPPGTGV